MDYDVLILGGGIIGCAVAYELSKYNINISLIEKDYDVANDISFVNTAVIYDGSETSDCIMASLEKKGRKLIEEHCKKFHIPYKKVGALRISNSQYGNERLDNMYNRAKERGISGVHIIDENAIKDIEPNLKATYTKALYCENTAVICPYNLAISYAEVAADNGVNFRLEEKVIDIRNISKGFKVTTNKNKFTCKFVVNTIPNEVFSDNNEDNHDDNQNSIISRKMNYILFNDKLDNHMNNIIINEIDESAFVIDIPTALNGNLIGIKGYDSLDMEKGLNLCKNIIPDIDKHTVTNIFTETYSKDSVCIEENKLEEGYVKVRGSHYAKITIAPAIAKKIGEVLKTNINIIEKKDYVDKKRDMYVFKNMTKEERNEIIKLDSRYGNIVCSCNCISEGEIVDCIRRPLGARTVEGVKRRTGIGLGSCNGAYCNMKIIKILAREMDKDVLSIVDDSMESRVLVGRIKEFSEI
ncbi:FAD/NAD(P)-binding oxidoreductase [Clostridium butyricum]|uniref:FAD-dependent oxidoreductase n=1 Tax=Clostridium butyricum TaxID=1492 RepID=A0A512TIY7_CLOBU|nr:FAD-dependent oxidoreductase [Clostridium butyricum]NAS16929.1 FAD-dependent oxidoreductase [Clostridium butyricum]NOW23793.1 L-2-hydroxyglutarate oxidase LhgO [Clostridium butyricum]GEQ20123.1 FAD/NAD(P)-binding oxidoreductase [Clostridium butyricum]